MQAYIREQLNFTILKLNGYNSGRYYRRYRAEERDGTLAGVNRRLLVELLEHAAHCVPYYREVMRRLGNDYRDDPAATLAKMPILTKAIIRENFDDLKSTDLAARRWRMNTTGGSTGEPVNFVQDVEFAAKADALKQLFSHLVGYRMGDPQVYFWGSIHDIRGGTDSWKARLMNRINNRRFINIFNLVPERMRGFIEYLNRWKPRLIVGYVWILYELARFARREDLRVEKQNIIISTAGTLYPAVRKLIEDVFGCRVYNRYGSREVGDIACERPGRAGLWVAPWGSYIEVVDKHGQPAQAGQEGRILVTSLINRAMPLIRYEIGDLGRLAAPGSAGDGSQTLLSVTGRSIDLFVNRRGNTVEAAHFMPLLYDRDWIHRYQVVQRSPEQVLFRIVPLGTPPPAEQLEEIRAVGRRIMGDPESEMLIEFVDHIPNDASGKFRFIKSEVHQREVRADPETGVPDVADH